MARGRKFKRGGSIKAKTEATPSKAVEEAVILEGEGAEAEVDTPETAPEAPVVVKSEPVGSDEVGSQGAADKPESENATVEIKDTPKQGNRGKAKGKKGKTLPESGISPKKTSHDLAGLIFMCNSDTKKDCFKYKVFGFPEGKKSVVLKVKKGTKLFLFDIDKKILHGIYKASSEGGMNLVEDAFKKSNRTFPAQVRFSIQKDCQPLDESVFKLAIKENYFRGNKFNCELNYEQVGKLMKLFRPLDAKGLPEPKTVKDGRRDSLSKNRTHGGPSRPQRAWRPPPSRMSAPAPPRERLQKGSRPVYSRERYPPEVEPRIQPSYPLVPEAAYVETEILRQRQLRQLQEAQLDALDRRAYLLDPVAEAALARKRYLEDLYAAEQQSLIAKRPLVTEPLYREPEYQREAPYRGYGDGLQSLSGALHYDSRSNHPAWH